MTAASRDFTDTMRAHLPLVFGFVLRLAFVLLLVAFRSLAIRSSRSCSTCCRSVLPTAR